MILIRSGQWTGRGSILAEGQSLGQGVACDVEVQRDDEGASISAEVDAKELGSWAMNVRIAPDEQGTYDVSVRTLKGSLTGTAKLDSPPNLGLLWNEEQTLHATFTLFEIAGGLGFRGFLRDGKTTYTWEIALSLRHDHIGGENVVSLVSRRRR
jgi:hypothetical protein